jgi:hypothetical protein
MFVVIIDHNPFPGLLREGLGLGIWCYATFNNISVILWHLVLLVEETGVPEKTTDLS